MATTGVPQFASLYVGDLHPDVTEAMLYEIFNSVGPVGSIRICRDSVTRRSLGYGYVNFHSVQDAERAIDTLNYSGIRGRACRIMWSQRDPSLRKSGVGNIFVKNLDRNIDNKALYDTFSLFGSILSCKVACSQDGKSRGYGFVHYETEEAAKQAIERVNGMQIGDKTVEVQSFLRRDEREPPPATYTNVYVKNLPDDITEQALKDLFSPFGAISSHAILEDKLERKFAFVNYEVTDSAQKAVAELHEKDIRTEEQRKASSEEEDQEKFKLYVGRCMTKAERAREFREKAQQAQAGAQAGRVQGVNLYIKNLDENTTDVTLKELFEPYGSITSAVAMKDEKEKCKGFGFVCFSSPDEATKAVTEMHLKVVKGKPLYVGLAEKKDARQERLRQRYSPGGGPMGKGGGKDGGKGAGGGGMGGKGKGPGSQAMGMSGPQGGPQGGMMGPMGGCGGMMGGPQMMGMKGMGGMMCGPMQMKGGMMGPGGKGPMGGMITPQMIGMRPGMMPPQMMGMMGGKGPMPGPMGGMMGGMMRPMVPMRGPMPQQPQHPQQPQQNPAARPPVGTPLNAATLASAPPNVQKQLLGEKLFPAIHKYQPDLAGKITGMMLEMDNSELLLLLDSEGQLKAKVDEAMRVLDGTAPRP